MALKSRRQVLSDLIINAFFHVLGRLLLPLCPIFSRFTFLCKKQNKTKTVIYWSSTGHFLRLTIIILYSEIRCIAPCVLQTSKDFWVFLFRQSSWRTSNTYLLVQVQKVMVCDSGLVDFDPLCLFRVSRFVGL